MVRGLKFTRTRAIDVEGYLPSFPENSFVLISHNSNMLE